MRVEPVTNNMNHRQFPQRDYTGDFYKLLKVRLEEKNLLKKQSNNGTYA